jgi:hypothetical protein
MSNDIIWPSLENDKIYHPVTMSGMTLEAIIWGWADPEENPTPI